MNFKPTYLTTALRKWGVQVRLESDYVSNGNFGVGFSKLQLLLNTQKYMSQNKGLLTEFGRLPLKGLHNLSEE